MKGFSEKLPFCHGAVFDGQKMYKLRSTGAAASPGYYVMQPIFLLELAVLYSHT